MMTHDEANELLAVFALDAVPSDTAAQLEEHLAQCPRCRAELDAHRETAAALGNSVEPLPEGLWLKIADRLPDRHKEEEPPPMPALWHGADEQASTSSPFRSPPTARRPLFSRGRRAGVTAAVAAVAALAAVTTVLGINLVNANDRVAHLQGAVGHGGRSAVVAALDTAGHKVVNLDSASHQQLAQLVVVPGGQGYLVSSHLPALSPHKTYQLWGVTRNGAISLGLLGRAPKAAAFTIAGSQAPSVLAVTVEPAGGSIYPTAPMLASGPL